MRRRGLKSTRHALWGITYRCYIYSHAREVTTSPNKIKQTTVTRGWSCKKDRLQSKQGNIYSYAYTYTYPRTQIHYTGRFTMFSVITNIYNKKTKGPTLMELFIATGKLKKFFFLQLEMFDACTTGDISNISSCQKKLFSVFLWLWTIPLR